MPVGNHPAGALNIGRLTADYEKVTFNKGDRIVIDLILLPFGENMDPDVSNAENAPIDNNKTPPSRCGSEALLRL